MFLHFAISRVIFSIRPWAIIILFFYFVQSFRLTSTSFITICIYQITLPCISVKVLYIFPMLLDMDRNNDTWVSFFWKMGSLCLSLFSTSFIYDFQDRISFQTYKKANWIRSATSLYKPCKPSQCNREHVLASFHSKAFGLYHATWTLGMIPSCWFFLYFYAHSVA